MGDGMGARPESEKASERKSVGGDGKQARGQGERDRDWTIDR